MRSFRCAERAGQKVWVSCNVRQLRVCVCKVPNFYSNKGSSEVTKHFGTDRLEILVFGGRMEE